MTIDRSVTRVLLALVLVLMSFPAHAAGGFRLAWSDCLGGAGTNNQVFACDSNTGSQVLVFSFVLPDTIESATGLEVVFDLVSQTTSWPAWWDFRNIGACRQTALTLEPVETPGMTCPDWGAGLESGGIASFNTFAGGVDTFTTITGSQHRNLKLVTAVPPSGYATLLDNTEYFGGALRISNVKTVGLNACSGCHVPVCIVLNSLKVTTTVPANDLYLQLPLVTGDHFATWQGAGANCTAVPVRNRTWGQVKALYR